MDDKFFSKIAKSVSEFMILAILKEKGESHPYEIQQLLLSKFSEQKTHASIMLEIMAEVSEKISQQEAEIHTVSKTAKEQSKKEIEMKSLLEHLNSEITIIKDYLFFPGKIWETIGAIYQVMNELEAQKYIEVAKHDIVKGRTRKIYKISHKGELEALKMMFTFNGINSAIYPQFLLFGDILEQFYSEHIKNLNNLFNTIGTKTHAMFSDPSMDIHVDTNHANFNPFSQIQAMIVLHLLTLHEYNSDMTNRIFSVNNNEQNLQLIANLKSYRDKIDGLISTVEIK